MARRGFGALPLIGVLTAPKLIGLAVGAYFLFGKKANAAPPTDVEAMPQGSIAPGGGGGGGSGSYSPAGSYYDSSGNYMSDYSDYSAGESAPPYVPPDYTPPGPTTDPYLPPTSQNTLTRPTQPSVFEPARPDRSGMLVPTTNTILRDTALTTPTASLPVTAPRISTSQLLQPTVVLQPTLAPRLTTTAIRGFRWPW